MSHERALQQFRVGDPIPAVLTIAQLAAILQVSPRTLADWRKAHSHPGIKELDMPGDPRFDGRVLKAWLDGGREEPASRHYFGKARRTG